MGYGNLGDAATQDVVIENIRKRIPDVELVAFSQVPDDTVKRHGILSYPILWSNPTLRNAGNQAVAQVSHRSRLKSALRRIPFFYSWAKPLSDFAREALSWARSYRALRGLDVLIISGGGQLTDLYGTWSHPYAIFKFCLLTKIAGKRLYFLNVGAGPLKHPLSRCFAGWAVRLANYRSFRDRDSQEQIRSLGVRAPTEVCPDAVYGLDVRDLLTRAAFNSSMPVVGINPMGFCDPRIWPRKDDDAYQQYLDKIVRFSVWLLECGYNLRVFSTDMITDRFAIEDLRSRLSSTLSSSPELLCQAFPSTSENVNDVLREMSKFDFVVTSKYHGIIFSHVLGKPVISLSYGKKMDSAMQTVGQGRFNANIERFDLDWLIKAFRSLVDDSDSIRRESEAAVKAHAATLSQQFDSLFLPDRF
jgi:polysaccharide pyruvyl transferase WcaK-like protein